MQTLKLLQDHHYSLDFNIGQELGYGGADGQVFELLDDPDKVIKLSVIYGYRSSPPQEAFFPIQKLLQFLIDHPQPAYVSVHRFQTLLEGSREISRGNTTVEQKFITYSYIMDKLYKLSSDEKKVFHTILSHEDQNLEKNPTPAQLRKLLDGLAWGLDFDQNRVKLFVRALRGAPIDHRDLHVRNVMKDKLGDYKLIDLDRAVLKTICNSQSDINQRG